MSRALSPPWSIGRMRWPPPRPSASDGQRSPWDWLPRAAAAAPAKVAAPAAAVHTCEATIQITGGLGMTWDHTAHRLYKRAMSLQSYLAGERRLYQDIADEI